MEKMEKVRIKKDHLVNNFLVMTYYKITYQEGRYKNI